MSQFAVTELEELESDKAETEASAAGLEGLDCMSICRASECV